MPRKCKICNHPKVKTTNSQLVAGKTYRNISQQFGMDAASVFGHVNNCLKLETQTPEKQIKNGQAIDHHTQFANCSKTLENRKGCLNFGVDK